MVYEYVNKIKVKYNPSVIEYSSKYQLFVCGSYQLIEDNDCQTSEETRKIVNNRLGNLLLISTTNELIHSYECYDGGVFDLKITQYNGDEDDRIIVAHSNGFVAIYSIDLSNKLQTIRRYSTNSSLLTSLTTINKEFVFVGNSEGKLISINLSDDTTQHLTVTKFCEPIWTLFFHRFPDNYLLFVGSDDTLMRIYSFNDLSEDLEDLRSIHTNKDSTAGITSFGSDYSSENSLSLIVGSYDEFIRFYAIEWINQKVNVIFKNKVHIPESGIWRIISNNYFKDTLLVSAMYSSAHILIDSKVVQTLDPLDSESSDKHLIYGLNCDSQMSTILMASFYGKSVYLFRKNSNSSQ